MRKGDINLSEAEYLEVIRRKTAVLFEAACRVSAIIADAPREKEKALSRYGYNLGIAFQLADDLFDYILETDDLGKEVGADLKEGKMTLPVIYALRQAKSADKDLMIKIIKDNNFSVSDFKWLVGMLEQYGGIAYTKDMSAAYIKKAKEALSIFSVSSTQETLVDIADYALARRV
jgi:octaprenyl-diphosphate synthase